MRFIVPCTLLTALLILGCGGGNTEEKVSVKIGEVTRMISKVEATADADDQKTEMLLKEAGFEMQAVQNLVIEGEYEQAYDQLVLLDARLQRFVVDDEEEVVKVDENVYRIYGRVQYQASGDPTYRQLLGNEDPASIIALKTGIRSALKFRLFDGSRIFMGAQTEVFLSELQPGIRSQLLTLRGGDLNLDKVKGDGALGIDLAGFEATIEVPANVEVAYHPLVKRRFLVVNRGGASWVEGGKKGMLTKYRGVLWEDGVRQEISVPVQPVVDAPTSNETVFTGRDSVTSDVPFRWHSPVYVELYQLQISDHLQFVTRVHDKTNIKGGLISLPLGPGKYYWRVRGFSEEGVPGPYTQKSVVVVKRGNATAKSDGPSSVEALKMKGPAVNNIGLQVIGTTVIVSGQTSTEARVNVNGVTAVMMEDGRFRAIVNFTRDGKQPIRIIATDKNSGAETIVSRTVKIKY